MADVSTQPTGATNKGQAQPEDGSVSAAEICCCYKLFNYLLIVIT
jgi:hypothetical protein